jgi:phospho-N-acetylmuramoyl-pentapeptide-transferase
MGDTGSLFLGGFTVALAFTADAELLLLPLCLIWIIEGVSVMLQVFFFKLTGKRIFKMAPIHHHFEMCKWSEVRVVFTFSFVTAVSCGLTFWLLA